MTLLTSSQLAETLKVSRARVSQYVSEGKLVGCFNGDGRLRRFDLSKVATALGRQLHPGQMLGNGAETRRVLAQLPLDDEDDDLPAAPKAQKESSVLTPKDPDRYEMARIQKAEEETRRLRRQNAEAEGLFVMTSEVERQMAQMLSQEIAEFEAVLRDGARRVADKLGQDFKVVRQILVDEWRQHRAGRSTALAEIAETAVLTDAERQGDI